MDSITQQAIAGTLKSNPTGSEFSVTLKNDMNMEIVAYLIQTDGRRLRIGGISPNGSVLSYTNAQVGDYILFTSAYSGAFIAVVEVETSGQTIDVESSMLCAPNDIGALPVPTLDVPVPQNTMTVMVASADVASSAVEPTANYITREQYWNLMGDSYSIAPGETRTVSYTVVSGRQKISSAEASISSSLGLSAGGGYGPISASVSASLNASASVSQQVIVSEEQTTFVSDEFSNTQTEAMVVYRWQLMDVITFFSVVTDGNQNVTGAIPQASIISGLNPVIPQLVWESNVSDAKMARAAVLKRPQAEYK